MSLELVKELIKEMEKSTLTTLECEMSGVKVKLSRENNAQVSYSQATTNKTIQVNSIQESSDYKENQNDGAIYINSPMVGTFYSASSPESADFVEKGAEVAKGDIVCIIEAMKLMNEIEAEVEGKVVEVLVKSGDMVEFGQPLFRLV